jgi:glycine/D-amino acid oxidase-like deaminating enzyme
VASPHSRPDVIIIGGGVIGCAAAYFLATEHGVKSLIIERNGIGSEASGGAAGELAAAELTEKGGHRPSPIFTRFLQEGISLHTALASTLVEESGVDYLLNDITMLRPAFTVDEATGMKDELARLHESGIDASWIEPKSIQAMHSWLSGDAVGAILSTEFQLEAYPFALALAQAAEQHGVEIRTGEVTDIELSGRRVTGVRLGDEIVSAPTVVIANGPWSRFAGEWIGLNVPVIPLRGQIVHLEIPEGAPRPEHAIFHSTGYVLPKAGGTLYVGTTIEDVGFDSEPTTEARDAIMEAVTRLAPQTIDIPIKRMTACLRPYSLDDMPIIGAVPGVDGLFIATGHGFKGITLCLITGKNLAELIIEGSSSFLMDGFSPARLESK